MDSMFEKTLKGMAKKFQKNTTVPGTTTTVPMEIDYGAGADVDVKPSRSKGSMHLELPPIINCERDLWRRTTASGSQRREESQPRPEEKPNGTGATEAAANHSRVDSWVST